MPYDAIVLGGSYAGLSAAMQLARARKRVLVIDAGLPRNRFSKHTHGFLGQDGNAPRDIIQDAKRQLGLYPTVELVDGAATTARKGVGVGGFTVTMAHAREKQVARIILATGMTDELPAISGMQERWGASVLHCRYCHGYEVGDRRLGVLANHAMSSHQAKLIPEWGTTTYFTQGQFEPDEDETARLVARGVRIERTPIMELLGRADELEAVRLLDGRTIPFNAIFTVPKSHVASPLAGQLGCAFEQGPFGPDVKVDNVKQPSLARVYAASDMVSMMSNSTLASASGVLAGVGVHQSLAMVAAVPVRAAA